MPGRSIFYEKLKQRINNTNNSRWRISNSKRYRRLSKGYVQRCNTRNVRKGAIALELGYEKGDSLNKNTENRRNGYSKKTVKSQFGNIELDIPRDRDNNYDPQVIPKHTRDISGLEEKIISLYARGMSTRDIHDQIKDLYGIEISAEYVSHITDIVIEHARLWQNRPLEPVYPFVFMDAIHYKVKEDSKIKNKAAYVILGVNKHGFKDVLIFSVDGLPGFKEAISASYPESDIQRCIIHQLRNTFKYVSYKDSKELMNDFKLVYEAEALSALDIVEEKWGKKYPTAIRIWIDNWDVISPFFSFPQEIRTIMYTTNIIEGVNRQFRKVTKTKSTFPSDESLLKMLYLASQNIMKKWTIDIEIGIVFITNYIYFDNRI